LTVKENIVADSRIGIKKQNPSVELDVTGDITATGELTVEKATIKKTLTVESIKFQHIDGLLGDCVTLQDLGKQDMYSAQSDGVLILKITRKKYGDCFVSIQVQVQPDPQSSLIPQMRGIAVINCNDSPKNCQDMASLIVPVKKDEKWKLIYGGDGKKENCDVIAYWIPLGNRR